MAVQASLLAESYTVDVLEFDIRLTIDGIPVLCHDDTLDRVSDSEQVFGETGVRPEDKTYAELLTLNMGYSFTDESGNRPYADMHGADVPDNLRIPTLYDVLDLVQNSSDTVQMIVEVKSEGDAGKKLVDILYREMTERHLEGRILLGSFLSEVAEYADEAYPDLPRGAYLSEVIDFYFAFLTQKEDYAPDFEVLQLPFGTFEDCYGINLGTDWVLNYAHEHNLAVQYWTVDNEDDIDYLLSMGADAITSNYPNLVSTAAAK